MYSGTVKWSQVASAHEWYVQYVTYIWQNFDGLVQDCSFSCALAMEMLQSCLKPSIYLPRSCYLSLCLSFCFCISMHTILLAFRGSKGRREREFEMHDVWWSIWSQLPIWRDMDPASGVQAMGTRRLHFSGGKNLLTDLSAISVNENRRYWNWTFQFLPLCWFSSCSSTYINDYSAWCL